MLSANVPWTSQLGTSADDDSRGVSADGLGNVYVTGFTQGSLGGPNAGNEDLFLSKYDDSGALLWTQQLGTSAREESLTVSADGSGNVYIAGFSQGSLGGTNAGNMDAFVAKYDSSGSLLWSRQVGTSTIDDFTGISADGSGNVYLIGDTMGSLAGTNAGLQDVFVSKYNSNGTLLWTEQLGTSANDTSHAISADGLGNVYITGFTSGSLGGTNAGFEDVFISKLDASGTILWTKQLGTSGNDYGRDVSADGLGNVYITGLTNGSLGGTNAGNYDAFIAKYDSSGTLLWTEQLGTSGQDYSYAVSADGSGNVYMSGETAGSLDGTNAGGTDAFVSKYDDSGALLWTKQIGTSGNDTSWGVSADGLGNVYVSGDTAGSLGGVNAGGLDVFLARLNESWTDQLGTSAGDDGRGASADGLGNVYITGSTAGSLGGTNAGGSDAFISKYDAYGTLLWTKQLGSSGSDVALGASADGLGSVYISGFTTGNLDGTNSGGTDAFISKYDASGTLLWTKQLGTSSGDEARAVSADGLGNVYITGVTFGNLGGSNAGNGDAYISKYDSTGTLLWTQQIGTSGQDGCAGVSADGSGNVYISGYTTGSLGGANAGNYDAFISKYDASGALLWTKQIGTSSNDTSNSVSVDGSGNVYISGVTDGGLGGASAGGQDAFLVKYDANGTLLWTRQAGTSAFDRSNAVSVDGLGNVYISGITQGSLGGTNAGSNDAFISKYDASGTILWTEQLGTSSSDNCFGVSVDISGNAYAVGSTLGSLEGINAGLTDSWVTRL
jgi:hypothetical protein